MSKNVKIDELLDITGRLSALMAQETDLLRATRASEIEPLQEEKATLVSAYANALNIVRRNPAAIGDASVDLRATLKDATADLKARLDDNLRAVQVAKTVNERVIRALGEAIAEQRSSGAAYTASGGSAPPTPAKGPLPITLNQSI